MFYAALFNLWRFLHIISYFYLLVCVFACVLVCVGVYFICFYLAHIHSKTFFNYIMHFRYAFRILICLYIHNIESLIVCLVFGFCFCFWYFFFVFFVTAFAVYCYSALLLGCCFCAYSLNRYYVYIFEHSLAQFICTCYITVSRYYKLCVNIIAHIHTHSSYTCTYTRACLHNRMVFSFLCFVCGILCGIFLFKIMHSFLLWLADSCLLFFLFTQITFSIYLYISIYMYIHIYLCIYRFVYICVKLCRQRCRQLAAVSWLALKNLVSPSFKK